MNILDFFNNDVVALPRVRDKEDFEGYLSELIDNYIHTVKLLDADCHLCTRIRSVEGDIAQLGECIKRAVRTYLAGTPVAAYKELSKGVRFVYRRLRKLFSRAIGGDQIGNLYRIALIPSPMPRKIPKERLFHAPFNLRYKVKQHRYGIPGFPCLYLGGSLELCTQELRLQESDLPAVAVAEFGFRTKVKVLDFGWRPSALAPVAAGSAMRERGANPRLEQFIIDYATCWPLIAASSIKVRHEGEAFVFEYIVPQMILQWAMRSSTWCDGSRYFSTRFTPDPKAVCGTANYVFPAIQESGAGTYSQKLKDTFELTDPILWGPLQDSNLRLEAREQEDRLNVLARAPIP